MTHPKDEAHRMASSQCGAKTQRGKGPPCKQSRMLGGVRCRFHGGASPQALRRAEETLAEWRLRRVSQLDKGFDVLLDDPEGRKLAGLMVKQPGLLARLLSVADQMKGGTKKVSLEGPDGGPIPVAIEDPLARAITADPEARAAAVRLLEATGKKPVPRA